MNSYRIPKSSTVLLSMTLLVCFGHATPDQGSAANPCNVLMLALEEENFASRSQAGTPFWGLTPRDVIETKMAFHKMAQDQPQDIPRKLRDILYRRFRSQLIHLAGVSELQNSWYDNYSNVKAFVRSAADGFRHGDWLPGFVDSFRSEIEDIILREGFVMERLMDPNLLDDLGIVVQKVYSEKSGEPFFLMTLTQKQGNREYYYGLSASSGAFITSMRTNVVSGEVSKVPRWFYLQDMDPALHGNLVIIERYAPSAYLIQEKNGYRYLSRTRPAEETELGTMVLTPEESFPRSWVLGSLKLDLKQIDDPTAFLP